MAFIQLLLQEGPVTLEKTSEMKLTLLDLAIKGGWVMIPIVLLSLVAAYIFIERLYVIKKATIQDANFMSRIKDYIHDGKLEAALALSDPPTAPRQEWLKKVSADWGGLYRISPQR